MAVLGTQLPRDPPSLTRLAPLSSPLPPHYRLPRRPPPVPEWESRCPWVHHPHAGPLHDTRHGPQLSHSFLPQGQLVLRY